MPADTMDAAALPEGVAARMERWRQIEQEVVKPDAGPISKSELKRRIRMMERTEQRRERGEARRPAGDGQVRRQMPPCVQGGESEGAHGDDDQQGAGARCSLLGLSSGGVENGGGTEPIVGADKYLGGVLGPDGKVYCMPGHATTVLRIDGATDRVERLNGWVVGDGVHADDEPSAASGAQPAGESVDGSGGAAGCVAGSSCASGARCGSRSGAPLKGVYKWLRGVCGRDGCIYGMPSHADTVLRIDPARQAITLMSLPTYLHGTKWKWHGGAVGHDGNIYGVPCGADCVLQISFEKVHDEPEPDDLFVSNGYRASVSTFGCPRLLAGQGKWYGGVLIPRDGCIYGIPQNAARVLKIVPHERRAELIGPNLGAGGWKWHGAVLSSKDGCLYAIPNHTSCVLKIDAAKYKPPAESEEALPQPPVLTDGDNGILRQDARSREFNGYQGVFIYDGHALAEDNAGVLEPPRHRPEGKYKYLGGVADPATGDIYCMPSDADRVLRIRPRLGHAGGASDAESGMPLLSLHGRSFSGATKEQNKWQNGFYCRRDRCIYGIPLKADGVLRIRTELTDGEAADPADARSVELVRIPSQSVAAGHNKWEGGVMDAEGRMFCMPLNSKFVLRVDGAAAPEASA